MSMLDRQNTEPVVFDKDEPPVMVVVIDTEEEFDWNCPFSRDNVATTAVAAQPLAHEKIFDKFGIVPTYVTDYPVVMDPKASATLKTLQDNGSCEIGAHLHPWVTPPHDEEVNELNSFAGSLPRQLEYQKLASLTTAIAARFGRHPFIYKAGRYGVGPHTAEILASLGYRVDTSVVSYTSFASIGGPSFQDHGPDPYWFGPAGHRLLELPTTTGFAGALAPYGSLIHPKLGNDWMKSLRAGGILARTGILERIRLTPEGASSGEMNRLIDALLKRGTKVLTLSYHSPSLSPGHTPYVRNQSDLRNFIVRIHDACAHFKRVGGKFMGVSQLHERLRGSPRGPLGKLAGSGMSTKLELTS